MEEIGRRKKKAAAVRQRGGWVERGEETLPLASTCLPSEEISTGFSGDAARSAQAQEMIRSRAALAVTRGTRGGERGGKEERMRRKEKCSSHRATGERGKHGGDNSASGACTKAVKWQKSSLLLNKSEVKKKKEKQQVKFPAFLEKGELPVWLCDCISAHCVMYGCEGCTLSTGAGAQVSSRWMVQCCCSHSNHRAKRRGRKRVGAEAGKKMA